MVDNTASETRDKQKTELFARGEGYMENMKSGQKNQCKVCGKIAHWKCNECTGDGTTPKEKHYFCTLMPRSCFLGYHSSQFYGLARDGRAKVLGKKKGGWKKYAHSPQSIVTFLDFFTFR